jgi:hypothetical protein
MGFGALAAAAVGIFNAKTALPLTGIMATCSFTALSILLFGRAKIRYSSRKVDLEESTLDLIEKY